MNTFENRTASLHFVILILGKQYSRNKQDNNLRHLEGGRVEAVKSYYEIAKSGVTFTLFGVRGHFRYTFVVRFTGTVVYFVSRKHQLTLCLSSQM